MWTLGEAYYEILNRLNQLWDLRTEPPDLLRSTNNLHFGFLEATYDESAKVLTMNTAALATYNLGPLVGSTTAKITLKMIVGLTLIYEQLFIYQQKQGEDAPPLTREIIREEARKFQMGRGRQEMSRVIEKLIVRGNCYDVEEAKSAAEQALKAGKSKVAQKYSKDGSALWNALV